MSAAVLSPATSSSLGAGANVGFSWNLLNYQLADGAAVDQFMADTDEHYIMKADLQICTQDGMQQKVKNRTVMLTEESFVEMKCQIGTEPPSLPPATSQAIITSAKQKKHKSLLEIHSIELDPSSQGTAFRIAFFSGSAASKAKAGFSKLARFLQVSSSFDDFLKVKIVRCHSAEECSQWMFVLDKLLRNIWQRKLESTLLPEPEVYKRHAFVIKAHNDRLLMLSDYWMYNVDVSYKPVELKQIKWAIPVSSFLSVSQFNDSSDLAVMSISFDADEAKKQFDSHHRNNKTTDLKNKHHEFIFRTKGERQRFVNSLAAVYWQVTRKKLPLHEKK